MIKLKPLSNTISDRGLNATNELKTAYQALAKAAQTVSAVSLDRQGKKKCGVPDSLLNEVIFAMTARCIPGDGRQTEVFERTYGFKSSAFKSELYGSKDIKGGLIRSHRGCCAFCESYLLHISHGDVEHFRPKAGCTGERRGIDGLDRSGYYWLAYEPKNLLLSCQVCNQVYKGNRFPLLDGAARHDGDKGVLINPYEDDPREFIRFNPTTGKAYDFGVLASFVPDRSTLDALLIGPLHHDPFNQITSQPGFGVWLKGQGASSAHISRGTSTISILSLNRPELVRARLDHLRQLRALFLTTLHRHVMSETQAYHDVGAAESLLTELYVGGAETRAFQFRSLSMDAIACWTVPGRQQAVSVSQSSGNQLDFRYTDDPWLKNYNDLLEHHLLAHGPTMDDGLDDEDSDVRSEYNDSVQFFLLSQSLPEIPRRVVYVTENKDTGDDVVKGLAPSVDPSQGWFLMIDWPSYADWTLAKVPVGSTTAQQMGTLGDLLKLSHQALPHKFKNCELWVWPPS